MDTYERARYIPIEVHNLMVHEFARRFKVYKLFNVNVDKDRISFHLHLSDSTRSFTNQLVSLKYLETGYFLPFSAYIYPSRLVYSRAHRAWAEPSEWPAVAHPVLSLHLF